MEVLDMRRIQEFPVGIFPAILTDDNLWAYFLAARVDSAKRILNSERSFDWIAPPTWAELTRSDWQSRLYPLKK